MKCPRDDSRQIPMPLITRGHKTRTNFHASKECMTGRRTKHNEPELFKGTHTTVCLLSVEQSFEQTILRQLTIFNDGVLKLVVVIHCRECIIYRFVCDESANINGYPIRTIRILISTNTKYNW